MEPAIRDAGYEPIRVDRTDHINRIDDEIIGQIRRARFMVADFNQQRQGVYQQRQGVYQQRQGVYQQRQGVYFESGLMMGLGRNVIWMCSKDEIDGKKVHFDMRQYNFIDWVSPVDAKPRLLNRIRANEGQGPLKKV